MSRSIHLIARTIPVGRDSTICFKPQFNSTMSRSIHFISRTIPVGRDSPICFKPQFNSTMSRSIHRTIPGYGPPDGSRHPCSGVSGSLAPRSCRGEHKLVSDIKFLSLRCVSRYTSSVCNASSSSYRRNPDFSKQNRHGYSCYRNNRHNETREEYEDVEDSETLSSKNGPLLSVSRNQKYQATATAGPRPMDIFEHFRKMHAQQEREIAAMKEGKKIEETQAKSKESETAIGDSSSSSYRRNLDFSKQNRHGYSRYLNNRHNETMEEYEDLEDSETLSSKNGPLLSVSRNQKYQATATAGPRPMDIFEHFRKMHAQQEREIAAMKEGKKIEETQAKSKESETVGSLLKLFRMSVQQGKKSNNTANNKDFILDQDKQIAPLTEERSTSIISDSTGSVKHETQEIPRPELTRPKSNFRIPEIKFRPPVFKRSPVPEIKFQPPVFTEETGSSMISMEPEACEEIQDDEYDSESDLDPLDEILDDKVPEIDETGNADVAKEEATVKSSSLLGMKLTELRALAKSRSMKGFSKLKKKELIEALSG